MGQNAAMDEPKPFDIHPPARAEAMACSGIVLAALAVSFAITQDRLTWLLETVWVMVALPLLAIAPPRLVAVLP